MSSFFMQTLSSSLTNTNLNWNPLFVARSHTPFPLLLSTATSSPHFRRFRSVVSASQTAAHGHRPIKEPPLRVPVLTGILKALKGASFKAFVLGILLFGASPSPETALFELGGVCSELVLPVGCCFGDKGGAFAVFSVDFGVFVALVLCFVSAVLLGDEKCRSDERMLDFQVCKVVMTPEIPTNLLVGTSGTSSFSGLNNRLGDHVASQMCLRIDLFSTPIRMWESAWNPNISKNTSFMESSHVNRCRHVTKAVATIEREVLVHSGSNKPDSSMLFSSSPDSQVSQCSNEERSEQEDREKLRRLRISKANKGNVPWNKGRKHSEETIRRIRERTKLAMQDPKVRMKLVNLGHAQSEETRMKIGAGVREGWQRRRVKLMAQEGCFHDWQNSIAEAARKGVADEDELEWDSYQILNETIKQEWLESIEKRKTMPRQKGSKRAPKSLEQRKKISEAIAAKWADPDYRNRVYSGLSKYHGTTVGSEKKEKEKPTVETQARRSPTIKKATESSSLSYEAKNIKKSTHRRRNSAPSYKDPMANTKIEMIKKIREQRAVLETKKREATERAKLLIAEAEKAAKALEIAALKNPIAQASLLETRKLIAEATRSLENVENGQFASQVISNKTSVDSGGQLNHYQARPLTISNEISNERFVNGIHHFSNNDNMDFDKSILEVAQQDKEALVKKECIEKATEVALSHASPPNVEAVSERTDNQMDESVMSGSNELGHGKDDASTLNVKDCQKPNTSSRKTKKKWVSGRLVDVVD